MAPLALALAASVAWGASDFLGGLASRRLPVAAVLFWAQLAGLAIAFGETLELGHCRFALAAAIACAAAPFASAIGNVAIKRGDDALDAVVLNGWAMLVGGALLLLVSALAEAWEATN